LDSFIPIKSKYRCNKNINVQICLSIYATIIAYQYLSQRLLIFYFCHTFSVLYDINMTELSMGKVYA